MVHEWHLIPVCTAVTSWRKKMNTSILPANKVANYLNTFHNKVFDVWVCRHVCVSLSVCEHADPSSVMRL